MERTRSFFEKDTRRLVEVVTGFKENDENFNLCLDFALSNFVSHKYVDEAWFKVRKRIEGLCERFHVHNQYEKANRLHALSSHFLNRLNELSIHEKNTGYSALSLLTYLCGSVESNGGSVCQSVDNEEEEEEPESLSENISRDVDWEKYLGGRYAESQSLTESDTESWSDSDDDSLTGCSLHLPYPPAPPSTDSGIEVTPDSAYSSYPPLQSFQPYHEHNSPKKPVQWPNRYWEPQYQTSKLPSCSHSRTSFTKIWETHLANKDPVYTPETNLVLTEGIVMRELLWMLNGIKETYLFEWQGDHFTVKQHVHLSHLTEDTLHALLLPFCHFGKKAAELHSFISEISSRSQTFPRCQTLDAYAYGMEHFLVKYSSALTSYEEKVVNQEETLTVIQLTSKLKPELEDLEFLHHIHTSIMQQIPENCTPSVAAVVVLDSLWKLLSAHGIWMDSDHFLQMLLVMFLVSVRPYVGMCESVVMKGQLTDPFSEFFIVKNQTASEDDGNFWNSVLMLREYPSQLLSDFFLRPCFEDSLRAGRSMEVLSKLESYYKRDGLSEVMPDYLFTKFTEAFQQFLSNFESRNNSLKGCDDDDVKNIHQSHSWDSWFALPAEKLNPASKEKSLRDVYKNQFALCEKAKEVETEYNKNFALCERTAKCVHSSLLRLPGDVVKHSLLSCIQTTCANSSNMLLNLLKEKHNLMFHFSVMKKYFLMEAGDIMFSFYTTVFDKIFDHIVWQNGYDLNSALKSCLILVDEEASEKLYIIVEEAGQNDEDAPLRQLDCIYMTYPVEWPINVILSPEIQDGYCQIFHFLLQIKCAKYNLDELHNNPLQQTAEYAVQPFRRNAGKKEHQLQVIHGMHILRMKLLHFVNGFHSYIMTRILHSSGLELKEKLDCAKSVDDILIGHRQYLVSLFERCLLDSKLPYLREQIQRVLNLTLKFQAIWRSGLDRVWMQDLREIEQDFSSSMNFLTSYLKKRWKSATGVHLDELAGAILTDTHTIHIFT